MRAFFLAAAFVIAAPAAQSAARAPAGLGFIHPQACASGYHTDAGGNCQPAIAEEDRYCAAGTVFHPTSDGWRCDPPPPEAY